MSPSEKLRALLDERGIEYGSGFGGDTLWTGRDGIEWRWDKKEDILAMYSHTITPEQAIAATVGNSTDLSKRLREVTGLHAFAELFGFDWTDDSDWSWHDVACAMADAIDVATVGTEPDEATMLKLHDRMNAALLDYESAMGIEHGNGANTVPFVIEMHQIIEDAATIGVGTCELVIEKRPRHGPWIYHFGCGYDFWQPTDCPIPILKHCPNCGKKIKVVSA